MYEWAGQHDGLKIMDSFLAVTRTVDNSYHVCGSFGDIYIQIALIKEKYLSDKLKNVDQRICIFISPKFQQLVEFNFKDDAANVIVWLIESNLASTIFNKVNLIGKHKNFPLRLLPTVYPMIAELIMSGKLLYIDFMRQLIGSNCVGKMAGLESSAHLAEAHRILNQNQLSIGKTVLICADNNTHTEFPEEFWFEIIKIISSCGWDICLNDSGTLHSNDTKYLKQLRGINRMKFIKIPPHLPTSMVTLMGSYIGGSNGFITVQACFSSSTVGMHLINCLDAENGVVKTPGGESIEINNIYSRNNYRSVDLGLQIEIPVFSLNDIPYLDIEIKGMLSSISKETRVI